MRIHRVSFSAFGPFPGSHTLDIDRVGACGLFLIEGPTGSGKTMILDAIVYGLYGALSRPESAGADLLEARLRSQYAPADIPTTVSVVFSVAAGIYRVERSVGYRRPKKRGEGYTTAKPWARLTRLNAVADEVGEPLASKPREVAQELAALLPLTVDQFRQTVVLPQGAFARFLHANSNEREEILRRVFGTEIYKAAQDLLTQRASELRRANDGLLTGVSERARALGEALEQAGITEAAALPWDEAARLDELPDLARPFVNRALERARAADVHLEQERQDLAQARHTYREVELLRQLRAEHAKLEARERDLAARADEIEAKRERIARARAAETVRVIHEAAESDRREAEAACARAREAMGQVCASAAPACNAEIAEVSTLADTVSEEALGALERLRTSAITRTHALAEALEHSRRRDTCRRDASRCSASLRELDDALAAGERRKRELTDALARQADLIAAAQHAEDEHRAQRPHRHLWARLAACGEDHEKTAAHREALRRAQPERRREAEAAHATYTATLDTWQAEASAELAAALGPGDPCPVCGACTHPRLARPASGSATLAQVHQARSAWQDACRALDDLDHDLRHTEAHLAELRDRIHPYTAAQVRAKQAEFHRHEREYATARERGRAAEKQREELERERHNLERVLHEHGLERSAVAQRLNDLEAQIRELDERIAGLGDDLETQAQDLRLLSARTEAAVTAHHEAVSARARAKRSHAEAARALAESPFATIAQMRAGLATPRQLADDEKDLRDHHTEVVTVRERLAELAAHPLASTALPELAGLRRCCDRLVARTKLAEETRTDRHVEAKTAQAAARGLAHALAQRNAALADALPLLRMAELAGGGKANLASIPLATWVLLARLDEVLAVANPKLAAITSGRFELVRAGSDGSRNTNQALTIDVIDHYASGEHQRRNATLSGGETFFCSLALSLALTEIVTAEAGGVEIGTMFIDEGFGTLDAETLEQVLKQLRGSHGGERTIGIISHVDAVRDQISERIEVRRHGASTHSTLRVIA